MMNDQMLNDVTSPFRYSDLVLLSIFDIRASTFVAIHHDRAEK